MILYRYELAKDDEWAQDSEIRLREFTVVRESDANYWISTNEYYPELTKIVRKNARKTYAYPTKKQALQNYIRRTKKHKALLERSLVFATTWLQQAENLYANLY